MRTRQTSFWLGVLVVLLALAGTVEERTFGTVTDEQEVLGTAVSMAEFGELGIARGQYFTILRPQGDAVSPYGVGLSLLEVPFVFLSPVWESRFGARSSQTLFCFLQILLVTAAAAAAGLLARALGATARGEWVAIFGTALASPLWAYPAGGLSEPLQAAALAGSLLLATVSIRRRADAEAFRASLFFAAGAGFLAGWAVLTKALNFALLPFLFLPIALDLRSLLPVRKRMANVVAWGAGLALSLGLWLAFEIARFGRPFASYSGQNFNHPVLDGLWRLTVGPNKGLILYFPLALLSFAGIVWLIRSEESRGTGLAIGGSLLTLLVLSSAWWAWDGTGGWGPRFLVPVIPLLAAAAGAVATTTRRHFGIALVLMALGVVVNLLGALHSESATFGYVASTGSIPISRDEALRYPPYYLGRDSSGHSLLPRVFLAGSQRAFSPLRLHALLLSERIRAADRDEMRLSLTSFPWRSSHPDAIPGLDPVPNTTQAVWIEYLLTPFTWPHLGRALTLSSDEERSRFNSAWDNAQADQVFRNLDIGRPERALRLARRLHGINPSGLTAALVAESLRKERRLNELPAFLDSLPERSRRSPLLALVQALVARDLSDEAGARVWLRSARAVLGTPAVLRALSAPLSQWPEGFHAFIAEGSGTTVSELSLPKLGTEASQSTIDSSAQ